MSCLEGGSRRGGIMRLNLLALVAGVLAFVSMALPWWILEVADETAVTFYVWGPKDTAPAGDYNFGLGVYVSLALIAVAGILALIGGVKVNEKGKKMLRLSGVLAVCSVVVFALFVHLWVNDVYLNVDSLFYSGEFGGGYDASAYLYLGFFVAVVAAVLSFVGYVLYPKLTVDAAPEEKVAEG
jgi:hypothetical protein